MSYLPMRTVVKHPHEVDEQLAAHPTEPVIVTRDGKPVWAIVPISQDALYDHVLMTAPEYVRDMDRIANALAARTLQTRPFSELLDER